MNFRARNLHAPRCSASSIRRAPIVPRPLVSILLRLAAASGKRLGAWLFAMLLLAGVSANAKLHTGEVRLYIGEGWDFSDSSHGVGFTGDISYAVTRATSIAYPRAQYLIPAADRIFTFPPALITYIGSVDGMYEDLREAPTDLGSYTNSEPAFPGDVMVVRTREAHYAKLHFLVPDGALVRFIYTYQDDGTSSLTNPISTRSTTWGRIKSLYK